MYRISGGKAVGDILQKPARPDWLKVRLPQGEVFERTKEIVKSWRLHTICEEALCPNVSECWGNGVATILVLGDVCTRGCRFCAVKTGNPRGVVDPDEPARVAEAVAALKLKYVVITSVDRDDLPDGGAEHFAKCVRAIHHRSPETFVEVLIPDFQGDEDALEKIYQSHPYIIGHNIETVARLTPFVRDRRAGYELSLRVLKWFHARDPKQKIKSGMMLGLGETREEVLQTLQDVRSAGVEYFTLGQYLQPTKKHLPVVRYVPPEEFDDLARQGYKMGYKMIASAPFVRSSYRADLFAASST
ncbi:MAG: lipoyl synthase [bacterium JZ-2024 1]